MHTVLRAYDALRTEGLIELRRGRGAVVLGGGQDAFARLRMTIRTLTEQAADLGLSDDELSRLIKETT